MKFRGLTIVWIALVSVCNLAFSDPGVASTTLASQDMGSIHPQSPYLTHAPLAFFSLGSLAVGGLVYALQSDLSYGDIHNSPQKMSNQDVTSIQSAVGISGLTALVSAAAYFYYSNRDYLHNSELAPIISGNLDGEGKLAITAKLNFPLGFFLK